MGRGIKATRGSAKPAQPHHEAAASGRPSKSSGPTRSSSRHRTSASPLPSARVSTHRVLTERLAGGASHPYPVGDMAQDALHSDRVQIDPRREASKSIPSEHARQLRQPDQQHRQNGR